MRYSKLDALKQVVNEVIELADANGIRLSPLSEKEIPVTGRMLQDLTGFSYDKCIELIALIEVVKEA
jgi:hypothetical protein